MNARLPIGTRLALRNEQGVAFPAVVVKPTAYHRAMGADAKYFVTVRITNPDGSTVISVQHVTEDYPVKVEA
jgi:hypothetical protein